MAECSALLLVQFWQVISVARPSAVEPVRMSCRLGPPCGLIWRPCSSSAVSLLMLALSECSSATLEAIRAPLALYQGPDPIRSRALTLPGPLVLRYACHIRLPAPALAASA